MGATQELLQKQAVLNKAESVVVSGVDDRRAVVRPTRASNEDKGE